MKLSFQYEGFPDGTLFHHLDGPLIQEFTRLYQARSDLDNLIEWLDLIPAEIADNDPAAITYWALADAALIAFCRIFKTGKSDGLIFADDIFDECDLIDYRKLRKIRNKLVAHDERLSDSAIGVIVLNKDYVAFDLNAHQISVQFVLCNNCYTCEF